MKEYIILEQHTTGYIQEAINLKSREYELVNISTHISRGGTNYYVAAMKLKKENYNEE